MKRTQIIESMIDEKWKSRRRFAEHIGIPPTTLQSILKRGVGNASIDNVIKICKGLGITIEQLEEMSKEEVNVIGEDLGTYETKDTSTCEYKIHAAIDKVIDLKVSQNIDLMAFLDLGTKTSKSIFLFKVYHLQYHDYHYIRPPSAVFFFCRMMSNYFYKK